jgi:hypothetical protein
MRKVNIRLNFKDRFTLLSIFLNPPSESEVTDMCPASPAYPAVAGQGACLPKLLEIEGFFDS